MRARVRRRWVLGAVAGASVVLTLTGCTRTAEGAAQWAPDQANQPVSDADAPKLLLDNGELVDIVGAPVRTVIEDVTPLSDDGLEPCAILEGAGQFAFLGEDVSAFNGRLSSDSEGGSGNFDHVAVQTAAVYSDAQDAGAAFSAVLQEAEDCDGETVTKVDGTTLDFVIDDATEEAVVWSSEQTNLSPVFKCFGEARVRSNVILRVLTCRGDRDGRPDTEEIVNEMSARVWELSAPEGGG